jgi:hypothetical protein
VRAWVPGYRLTSVGELHGGEDARALLALLLVFAVELVKFGDVVGEPPVHPQVLVADLENVLLALISRCIQVALARVSHQSSLHPESLH